MDREVVERPRPAAGRGRRCSGRRSSTSPAGPTGSRRSTSRWPRWPSSGAARGGSRRRSAGYVVYLFLTWWLLTHRLDRFWLPLLPPLAVLAGLGADWTRGKGVVGAAGRGRSASAFVANLVVSPRPPLTGLNEWTGDLDALRTSVPAMLNPPLAAARRRAAPRARRSCSSARRPSSTSTTRSSTTPSSTTRRSRPWPAAGRPTRSARRLRRAGHHPRLRRLARDRALPVAGQLRVHPVRHPGRVRPAGEGRGARTGGGGGEKRELYHVR